MEYIKMWKNTLEYLKLTSIQINEYFWLFGNILEYLGIPQLLIWSRNIADGIYQNMRKYMEILQIYCCK